MNKVSKIGMALGALVCVACGQQQSGAPADPMMAAMNATPVVSVTSAVREQVARDAV